MTRSKTISSWRFNISKACITCGSGLMLALLIFHCDKIGIIINSICWFLFSIPKISSWLLFAVVISTLWFFSLLAFKGFTSIFWSCFLVSCSRNFHSTEVIVLFWVLNNFNLISADQCLFLWTCKYWLCSFFLLFSRCHCCNLLSFNSLSTTWWKLTNTGLILFT